MSLAQFQPEQYDQLWSQKVASTFKLFEDLNPPSPELYTSPKQAFRMRAEFKIWHDENTWHYVMFERGNKHKHYKIDAFPIASDSIQALMPKLREQMLDNDALSKRLFQVEFLSTTTQELLVTLIYHKKLDEQWLAVASALAEKLNIKIIGRAKKQKLCTHDDYVTETLSLNGKPWHYQQIEASFTQPNAIINTQMLGWASQRLGQNEDDLLELYCGNGNFTMPLSQQFRQVIATEISKTSINSALHNCKLNHVENIQFLRMSSEEFTQAMNKEREFRRLKDINLDSFNLNTVLVDPPRAGLDEGTVELVRQFDRILYISCNPETLVSNLKALQCDFKIRALAFFDQFPYTNHMETGVLLAKQ